MDENSATATQASVGELLIAPVDTITPDESITIARRRMESQTARSLIVVDGDRPVGVIQWRGLSRLDGDIPVRDVMLTEIPVLRSDMRVDEARDYVMGLDVDLDHFPVVDESGMLIGEAPRGVITKREVATGAATEPVVSGPEAERDVPTFRLEHGMDVVGASGKKLGAVDQVDLNSEGNIAHFSVKHGLLGRNAKRLPADLIRAVDSDGVHLTIDQTEFKMLADIGDEPF